MTPYDDLVSADQTVLGQVVHSYAVLEVLRLGHLAVAVVVVALDHVDRSEALDHE